MILKDVVCVTTFREGDVVKQVEKIRSQVFMDTVTKLTATGLSVLAVHIDTSKKTLYKLAYQGVVLIEQSTSGMGNVRREALAASLKHFPDAKYICWLEPEKPDMAQFIAPMVQFMKQEQSVMGIFNRREMSSYPAEQAYYYLFCRSIASKLVGFDFDYAFGPMMLTPQTLQYFLEYESNFGDKWDSILVPRLRVIKAGLQLSRLSIGFRNDKRMTEVETGNADMILKRITQFNNVVPSLLSEWQTE